MCCRYSCNKAVPIRMTEAWLLLDESAIRRVVGRPHGTEPVKLPGIDQVERMADTKGVLAQILRSASGATGRKLRKIDRDFPHFRRQLLQDLPVGGLLDQVSSWVRFRDDLAKVVTGIQVY